MTAATTGNALDGEVDVLSCYTANLARYLGRHVTHPLDHVARSVRLAVRPDPDGGDELTFSHHDPSLHRFGDTELGWRASTDPREVLDGLAAEAEASGAVLALADTGSMSWAPAAPGDGAPHLLLIDDDGAGRWHVVDRFAALTPEGEQAPFDGTLDDTELLAAMTPRADPPPEQRRRTAHLTGVELDAPPPGTPGWMVRRPASPEPPRLSDDWITDDDQAREFLARFFGGLSQAPERRRFVDDLWAAAAHHAFRHRRLAGPADATEREAAAQAWTALPSALRFAADSVARGRARTSVVATTFDAVGEAERAVARSAP